MRHAKSSWESGDLADIQRPLNKRGEKAAPFMGKLMKEKNLFPDLIICSSAVRARQTLERVQESARFDCEIRFDERIYGASVNTLIYILSEVEENFEKIMICGHNPGFEGLVKFLCGEYTEMPTGALAIVDLKIDAWSKINADWGNLRDIYRPRELMEDS